MRRLALLTVVVAGCAGGSGDASVDCRDELCESALTITVARDGGAFDPGVYAFDVHFDGLRTTEDCTISDAPQTNARCSGELITAVVDNFAVTAFRVKGPAADRAVITVRRQGVDSELASQTFEPTYACKTGCRSATATMMVKSP